MSDQTPAKIKKNLPELSELHHDIDEALKNDKLKLLLNQPPLAKWLKKNPFATQKNTEGQNVPADYMPIDKVEFLLDRIFQEWKVEVKEYKQLFNAVSVCIRLHYLNPTTGEWNYHDGVGAVSVQIEKGKAASDLSAIKHDSVMKGLPAAKSYAIKDAADHLGKLFGRDLNRRDTLEFTGGYSKEKFTQEVQMEIERIGDEETLNKYFAANEDMHKNLEFRSAINTQRAKIKGTK